MLKQLTLQIKLQRKVIELLLLNWTVSKFKQQIRNSMRNNYGNMVSAVLLCVIMLMMRGTHNMIGTEVTVPLVISTLLISLLLSTIATTIFISILLITIVLIFISINAKLFKMYSDTKLVEEREDNFSIFTNGDYVYKVKLSGIKLQVNRIII